MSLIDLNDDDVVTMPPDKNFVSCPTCRIKEIRQSLLLNWIKPHLRPWFTDGAFCEVLLTDGHGWRKGKLLFRLEFIPDEPQNQSIQ